MYKFAVLLLIAITWSCCDTSITQTAHEHESEESTTLTLFSKDIEFFVEFEPTGSPGTYDFLAHLTLLKDYSPAGSGKLEIRQPGKSLGIAELEREGIFDLEISGIEPGIHALEFIYTDAAGNCRTVSVMAEFKDHEHEAENGEINFLKEQAWKSDFMVSEIRTGPFYGITRASGQINAVPGKKRHISASASGIMVFARKNLVQGSFVKEGDPLFNITAENVSGDNFEFLYRERKAILDKSRSEFKRHQELFLEKVISERKYIESRTAYITDSIRFENISVRANENGLLVRAPISGYLHELNFAEGQYVESGQQLATISSDKKLLLHIDVPMQFYSELKNVETANFRTVYSNKIYSIDDLHGQLLARGSSVAENDHYIPLYFEVENDGTLLEGAYIECFLLSPSDKNIIKVPSTAILEEQGHHYVFLQLTGENYSKQPVELGRFDGISYEVLDGIHEGDRVVTEGAMILKAASMVVGNAGDGHSH